MSPSDAPSPLPCTEVPEVVITEAVTVGKSRLFVRWSAEDGNSAITGYRLQYMPVGSDQWIYWSEPVALNASSAVLTGLQPSRGYRLRLTADNAVGRSRPAEAGRDGRLITLDHGEGPGTGHREGPGTGCGEGPGEVTVRAPGQAVERAPGEVTVRAPGQAAVWAGRAGGRERP